jgi:hypothetical protein
LQGYGPILTGDKCALRDGSYCRRFNVPNFVIPAKAGSQHRTYKFQRRVMDSRLCGNDEIQ